MEFASSGVSVKESLVKLGLFALLTSVGYLFYELLLKDISPAFLLLNTFFWIFIFRVFPGEIRPRSPLSTIRVSVDSYQLAYALSLFGYWYLFWHGISLVPSGENASKTAIAFLALNTFLAPIAGHFATPKEARHISLVWMFSIGLVLFFSIILMERNASAKAIGEYIGLLEFIFQSVTAPSNRQFPLGVDESQHVAAGAYVQAALCLFGAILCEAAADYLNVRRQVIDSTQFGKTLGNIQMTAARVEECRKSVFSINEIKNWIGFAKSSLLSEIEDYRGELRSIANEISKLNTLEPSIHDTGMPVVHARLVQDYTKWSNLIQQLEGDKTFLDELESYLAEHGDRGIDRSHRKRLAYIIGERYWDKALKKVEEENNRPTLNTAKRFIQESGDDLLAVLGLSVSTMVFLGSNQHLGLRSDLGIVGQIFGLVAVGAVGSTARLFLIGPMVRRDSSVLHLVPAIYAIRPIMLFSLMVILVTNGGLVEFLAKYEVFTGIQKPIVERQVGWLFGATLASLAAVGSVWLTLSASKKARH